MTSTTAPPSTATTLNLDHEKEPAASGLSTQRNSFLDVPKKEEDASSTDIETGTAQAPSPEPAGDYPGGFQLSMIVLALVLSIFLASLDMTIVATAIPKITDEFDGLKDVSWYGAAYFMCVGGFQSTWGKAYKYFPLKASFLISIGLFELGSLISGVAPNSVAFIVGRAIAGVGSAGIASGAYTIIGFSAPPDKRPLFTGITGASYGIAAVVGPLIGGAFSDKVTWRWCFYINLPIGGLSVLAILLFFRTPEAARPQEAPLSEKLLQMDPVGTVLVMAGIISYILALQYGGLTESWNSSKVIGLLVGFVAIFIVFIIWEIYQGERAAITPRIVRRREIWVGSAFAAFIAGSYFLMIYYLPIYFQSIDGVDPTQSGVRNLPLIIAVTIATIASGASITTNGHAAPLMIVFSAIATVAAGLIYTLDIGTASGKWIGYQILAGVGYGASFQVPMIMAQATSTPEDLAAVTAIVMFFLTVGGAFFVSAAQTAFVNVLLNKLPISAPGVPPAAVIATGATELRQAFPPEVLPGVLVAYMDGLKVAFAIAIAGTGLAFIISLANRLRKLDIQAVKSAGGAAA